MKQDNTARELTKKGHQSKILAILLSEPLTFTELLEKTKFSRATLSLHLRALSKEGLIQKVWNKKRVYQVASKEKAIGQINSTVAFLFGFIFGMLSAKSKEFVAKTVEEALEKPSEPIEIEEIKPKGNGD